MKKQAIKYLISGIALLLSSACGTKVGTGAVDVQFTNNTAGAVRNEMRQAGIVGLLEDISTQSNSFLGVTPTIYQIKLVTMYIVEDIDANWNNVGTGTHIWTSNKCDSDLTHCGIGPDAAPYQVDYFDFAAGSAAVNATLSNFKRTTKDTSINPGTYRYLRIDFTGKVIEGVNDTVANFKFGTATTNEVRAQKQAVLVHFDNPLVLKEGETFTVDLAYDLEKRFYSSASSASRPAEVPNTANWTCNGSGSSVPCIVEAEFNPTVTKK